MTHRETDIAIAKALGWTITPTEIDAYEPRTVDVVRDLQGQQQPQVLHYSTDPDAMLVLIDVMRERGWDLVMDVRVGYEPYAKFNRSGERHIIDRRATTLPAAVAMAALKALEAT